MRIKILITIIIMSCNYCLGQSVYYYTLSKIIDYGKESTKCSGGQFVKVSKNICYDVDASGNDVGNGKLYRDISSESNINVYIGDSYHGKSRYLFSPDFSTLIVEINPHYKYIYKKVIPPPETYTCSLIKKKCEGGTEQPINVYDNNSAYSEYPQGGGVQSTNGASNTASPAAKPVRKFKCGYCYGTGRIERNDIAPPSFGQSKADKKCNECGKWYNPEVFVHYHQQCRHCGGTGYTK